jgi:hypothetical protein
LPDNSLYLGLNCGLGVHKQFGSLAETTNDLKNPFTLASTVALTSTSSLAVSPRPLIASKSFYLGLYCGFGIYNQFGSLAEATNCLKIPFTLASTSILVASPRPLLA